MDDTHDLQKHAPSEFAALLQAAIERDPTMGAECDVRAIERSGTGETLIIRLYNGQIFRVTVSD